MNYKNNNSLYLLESAYRNPGNLRKYATEPISEIEKLAREGKTVKQISETIGFSARDMALLLEVSETARIALASGREWFDASKDQPVEEKVAAPGDECTVYYTPFNFGSWR